MTQFERLVDIMRKLRAPDGCPWDREQTHQTLKPYLIEEAYEVLDAIDANDDRALAEELGDVLLQVVFHAQVASEDDRFTVEDVARAISEKLERRHPHVFGDVKADTPEAVLKNWDAIKKEEKADKGEDQVGLLDDVPRHLPALMRAEVLQKQPSTAQSSPQAVVIQQWSSATAVPTNMVTASGGPPSATVGNTTFTASGGLPATAVLSNGGPHKHGQRERRSTRNSR